MRFLVDAQLPPALARRLSSLGHDAHHVTDLGLRDATDDAIWRHAMAHDFVIVSKDEDFGLRRAMAPTGPRVLWIRLGNTRTGALLAALDPHLPAIVTSFERGEVLVEVV